MRALVTGAGGFIGGHLMERLLSLGWNAAGVDDCSGCRLDVLPRNVTDVIGICDFADPTILSRIDEAGVDVIFHLAAQPRVSMSVERPSETHEVNVSKTVGLFEAVRRSKRKPRIVFASSSSVYGDSAPLPTPESASTAPQSPYALQKLQVEQIARLWCKLYAGFDVACLRFFNVFGPRQLGGSPYAQAIAAWTAAAVKGAPLRSDGDGQQTRDMCYVSNVVDALVAAAQRQKPFAGAAVNVACGQRHSNAEILAWFEQRYPGVTVESAPERAGDVKHTHADLSVARAELGYEPRVDLWQGLELVKDWADANRETVARGFVR